MKSQMETLEPKKYNNYNKISVDRFKSKATE